jgi:hypothetical protein
MEIKNIIKELFIIIIMNITKQQTNVVYKT